MLQTKTTMMDEFYEQKIKPIFNVFNGMDEKYKAIVREYHKLTADKGVYTQSFLQEKKNEALKAISDLFRTHRLNALNRLEQLDRELDRKKEVKQIPTDTQGKILYELQRSNNLVIFKAQLERAGSDLQLLKELYTEYRDDEDFLLLLDLNVAKLKEYEQTEMALHIENDNYSPFRGELNKAIQAFKLLTSDNTRQYPMNAENGYKNIRYRSVNTDLDQPLSFKGGWN